MKLPLDPTCCALALGVALTTAGTRATPIEPQPRPAVAVEEMLESVVRRGARRFTDADVRPIINELARARIDDFVLTMDPKTGQMHLEVGDGLTPHLDIKPGSCPNSINVVPGGGGAAGLVSRVSSGVLGNAFDVTQIDIGSTKMSNGGIFLGATEEISPLHVVFADVGTPFVGRDCACHALTGDGILDFVAQFDKSEMTGDLGLDGLPHNSQAPMRVFGMLTEGRGIFSSTDCVRVITHGSED